MATDQLGLAAIRQGVVLVDGLLVFASADLNWGVQEVFFFVAEVALAGLAFEIRRRAINPGSRSCGASFHRYFVCYTRRATSARGNCMVGLQARGTQVERVIGNHSGTMRPHCRRFIARTRSVMAR